MVSALLQRSLSRVERRSGAVVRGDGALTQATQRVPLPVVALLPASIALVAHWTLGSRFELDAATAGFVVGTLVGLTGMGSGALMTPVLILVIGVPPVTAVGTDLAYAALTKLVGGLQHARQGTVDRRLVRRMATGSVPAALVGVGLVGWLQGHVALETLDTLIRRGLGGVLVVASAALLVGLLRTRRSALLAPASRGMADGWRATALGAVVGFLVGLTSIGSGSLIVAVLSLASPLPAATIVGSDVAHAALLSGVAALAHGAIGHVEVALALSLLAGSLPGVLLGSSVSVHMPPTALRVGLAGVLLASAVALF